MILFPLNINLEWALCQIEQKYAMRKLHEEMSQWWQVNDKT